MKQISLVAAAAWVLWALVGCAQTKAPQPDYPVEILAVNVGKADALLVRVGAAHYLIDAGTKKSYDQLTRAMDAFSIPALDGVFLTHTDKDHAGGLEQLAEGDMPVGAWYASALYFEKAPHKHPLTLAAGIRDASPQWLDAGAVIDIDGVSAFHILAPLTVNERDENNNSLVMLLTTPHGNALFTGDMKFGEETALVLSGAQLDCAYLKVPYHGGDDATGHMLIAGASPEIAVISTSTAERAATPHPDVLKRLTRAGATVYVTQDFDLGVWVALEDGRARLLPEADLNR